MLTITLILLVLGGLLATFGTLGFTAVYHQPGSTHEAASARKTATAGRWLTIPGLSLYAGHYAASGIGLYLLMGVVAVTVASLITKANTQGAPART